MTKDFKREEQYIIDESPEISIGENTGWIQRITSIFPAFKNRNFRLYFAGQFTSLIGTWLQIVAQSWLVLQLTNSAFLMGLVAAIGSLPTLLFSLFGGVIVDRFPKKKIVIFTQIAAMILAFTLGILTILKIINVVEIAILAFLLGTVSAIDMPARQVFTVEMVGKKDLASAIAINSGTFNAARVVGPAVAGLLIAVFGTGGAFILNGVSYIAVIIALFFIKTQPLPANKNLHPIKAVKEGVKYAFFHPLIKTLLLFAGVVSVFGWSYSTLMPIVAQNTFHLNATGLGYMYSATGLGAVAAMILISAFSQKRNPFLFILGGNMIFAISMILFTFVNYLPLALILLFLTGFGLLSQFSMINTTIQHSVSDEMRGRVMSLYTLMFVGLSPIGNFEIGLVAERTNPEFAIRLGVIIALFYSLYLFTKRKELKFSII